LAEIIAVEASFIRARLFEPCNHLGVGVRAQLLGPLVIAPDLSWCGRVVDAMAQPIDGGAALHYGQTRVSVHRAPPAALKRVPLTTRIRTGVRAIDAFTPIARGQRIGIFAGSGVGKSTLLSMLLDATGFDATVVALVGERGREVRNFVDNNPSRERTITIVATGDESALKRRTAAQTAMTIAEYLRDKGRHVLLVLDSLTRVAHAAREIALSAGEAPVARGYPTSVFADLPRLVERAGSGNDGHGSITAVFSVLVDGDDHNDPVADTVRGLLDGHIVLDRSIAAGGRFPAIDLTQSVSRLANDLLSPEQHALAIRLRTLVSRFEDTRDVRLLGGYQRGNDPDLDKAVDVVPRLYRALEQAQPDGPDRDAFSEIAAAITRNA
jgi:flagellum-specific ATP synthase